MKGIFITFEGCEGVGKSTQVKLLTKYLQDQKREVLCLREPGGNPISEQIRGVILNPCNTDMSVICEAMLYSAARAQLMEKVIIPALERGVDVICDRFIDSTYAYQGYARNLGMDIVENLNKLACKEYLPNATLFLNLSPKLAFIRKGGADLGDRIENEGMEFHEKVYEGYQIACNKFSNRIINIDSSGKAEDIFEKIILALKSRGIIN